MSLADLQAKVTKRMGENSLVKGNAIPGANYIPTGIFLLDIALLGGYPESFPIMIFGLPSSGKTSFSTMAIAEAQKKYPTKAAVLIDAEGTYDPLWAERLGVNNENLLKADIDTAEQTSDLVEAILEQDESAICVLDSLPAMIPEKEQEMSAEKGRMPQRPAILGRMCSGVLTATRNRRKAGKNIVPFIMINQYRSNMSGYGSPYTLPGGYQPKFISGVMVEFKKKKEHIERDPNDTDIVDHNEHIFSIKKNKLCNSCMDGEFKLTRSPYHRLGVGKIDQAATVYTYAKKHGFLSGAGKLDLFDKSFKTKEQCLLWLEDNDMEYRILQRELIKLKRSSMGLPVLPPDKYLSGLYEQDCIEYMKKYTKQDGE